MKLNGQERRFSLALCSIWFYGSVELLKTLKVEILKMHLRSILKFYLWKGPSTTPAREETAR